MNRPIEMRLGKMLFRFMAKIAKRKLRLMPTDFNQKYYGTAKNAFT